MMTPFQDPPAPPRWGDAVLRTRIGRNELVITTTARVAGAVHSLMWDGQEYVNSVDHGRQMQSACSFDCGLPGEFWAESYNPTEAGSRGDHIGERSTSRLLDLHVSKNRLTTRTQMAFWLAPGEVSEGRPALNDRTLSRTVLTKDVRVGVPGLPQVLNWRVVFTVSARERRHTFAQFEALTGYMPAEFSEFWAFDTRTRQLIRLSEAQGEQNLPVVLSTPDGRHAMGIYSPDQPSPGFEGAGYGRFRFPEAAVVKWNCVFRVRAAGGIVPGEYAYRMYVPFGTRAEVEGSLRGLTRR